MTNLTNLSSLNEPTLLNNINLFLIRVLLHSQLPTLLQLVIQSVFLIIV